MRRALLCLLLASGCSDQLATIQDACRGTWVLEARRLPGGTRLIPPRIEGTMHWRQIDERKAHVSLVVIKRNADGDQTDFSHSACVYEISTSAVTRKRHYLVRQIPRRENVDLRATTIAKTLKGKAAISGNTVTFTHTPEEADKYAGQELTFKQTFTDGVLESTFTGEFRDIWRRK